MRLDLDLSDLKTDDWHKFRRFVDEKVRYYDLRFDTVESNENWIELNAKNENVEFNIKIRRK